MAKRSIVTDIGIRNLKPRAVRFDTPDSEVRGLVIKTEPTGAKTFSLIARYPPSKHSSRRAIAHVGDISLEEARTRAREWKRLIKAGIDPATVAADDGGGDAGITYEDAVKLYLSKHSHLKSIGDVRRQFTYLPAAWAKRPLSKITKRDVIVAVDGIASKSVAHNVFGSLRTAFNWWLAKEHCPSSPCDKFDARKQIGKRVGRTRRLSDTEIRVFWEKTEAFGYPYRELFRLIAATGLRRNEWAQAKWSEIQGQSLVIPGHRNKSGREYIVPLNSLAREILASIPRIDGAVYIFSSNGGRTAVRKVDEWKGRINDLGTGEQWQLHDWRRTLSQGLRKEKVDKLTREALLNHSLKGLDINYEDGGDYEEEKIEASEKWAKRLRGILSPDPDGAKSAPDNGELVQFPQERIRAA